MQRYALWASGALGALVTVAGVMFLLTRELASQGFGVPAPSGDPVWQHIAGMREVAIGVYILWLVAKRQTQALAWLMLIMVVIPLGDFYFAVSHAAPLWLAAQHAVGAFGMLALWWFLRR